MTRTDAKTHSDNAMAATTKANDTGDSATHTEAAMHHGMAAMAMGLAGDKDMQDMHAGMQTQHTEAAQKCAVAEACKVTPPPKPSLAADPNNTSIVADNTIGGLSTASAVQQQGAIAAACSAAAATRMAANAKLLAAVAKAQKPKSGAVEASVSQGGWSVNDLRDSVESMVRDIPLLNAPNPSGPNSNCGPCSCWVCDMEGPVDDDDNWTAIVRGADGQLYGQDFDLDDDGGPVLDGDPELITKTTDYEYVNDILMAAKDAAAKSGLAAGGPGSGRHAENAEEKTTEAWNASTKANAASMAADKSGKMNDHDFAAGLHGEAADAHKDAMKSANQVAMQSPTGSDKKESFTNDAIEHKAAMQSHMDSMRRHEIKADAMSASATPQPAALAAAGTSDGASMGHATRKSALANMATTIAGHASEDAGDELDEDAHRSAADAHMKAYDANEDAYQQLCKADPKADSDAAGMMDGHMQAMLDHKGMAAQHLGIADDIKASRDRQVFQEPTESRAADVAALHNAISAAVKSRQYPSFPFRDALNCGDFPGHPFRGNQHVSGGGSSDKASSASEKAHVATKGADNAKSHKAAAMAHTKAAAAQDKKGNSTTADYHRTMANFHSDAAKSAAEARAAGATGLQASNPEGINQYTKAAGDAESKSDKAFKASKTFTSPPAGTRYTQDKVKAVQAHRDAADAHMAASKAAKENGNEDAAEDHKEAARFHKDVAEAHNKNKRVDLPDNPMHPGQAKAASGAAGSLQAIDTEHPLADVPPQQLSDAAGTKTKEAEQASMAANQVGTKAAHDLAAEKHTEAADAHMLAYEQHSRHASDDATLQSHMAAAADHNEQAANHQEISRGLDACNTRDAKVIRNLDKMISSKRSDFGLKQLAMCASLKHGVNVTEDYCAWALNASGEDPYNENVDADDGGDFTNDDQTPFDEGFNADEGADNPYDDESEDGQQWQAGYDAGHSDGDVDSSAVKVVHDELKASRSVFGLDELATAVNAKHGCKFTAGTVAKLLVLGGLEPVKAGGPGSGRRAGGETKDTDKNNALASYHMQLGGLMSASSTAQPTALQSAAAKPPVELRFETALHASSRVVKPVEAGASAATGGEWKEPGYIMWIPGGRNQLTPSQNGKPVTVVVEVDASAAEAAEAQRKALTAKGKKPFFSIQHSTEIAAFWPDKFSWDTRMDATGKMATGVWADGEWSGSGKRARDEKDFRSFSPTFFVDDTRNDWDFPAKVVCNVDARANMGALENDPAFGAAMSPIFAKDASGQSPQQHPHAAAVRAMTHALAASNQFMELSDMVVVLNRNGYNVTEEDVGRSFVT